MSLGGGDHVIDDFAKSGERLDRSCSVANASRREEVRTVADVDLIFLAPADKCQILILWLHDADLTRHKSTLPTVKVFFQLQFYST